MFPISGTINSTLAWHLPQILFPQKNIKTASPIFETRQNSRLPCFHQHPLPLSFFCLLQAWHERFFCSNKSFSVCWWWSWRSFLWMDLVSLEDCYKHITHLGQPPPPIHFNEICLFCYKSWFDFGEVKCPPLPRRNGTCYMSPLRPPLLKSLML